MATSSIPASSATRKRRPSPELILRCYRQECITGGDRGAANRAAVLLGISDDTVRRVVARDEAARKAREETPQDLLFTPPDAAYEAQRDIMNRTHAAELAARLPPDVRRSYVKPERESSEHAVTSPQADTADHRTSERGTTPQGPMLDAAPETPDLPATPQVPVTRQTPESPERQGDPYDGDGTMEPQPVGVPRSPSGGELPEERPHGLNTMRLNKVEVQRVIVRVPQEHQGGLIQWAQAHEAAAKQLLALAVFLLLLLLVQVG